MFIGGEGGGQRVCWPPVLNHWGDWPFPGTPLPTPMTVPTIFLSLVFPVLTVNAGFESNPVRQTLSKPKIP